MSFIWVIVCIIAGSLAELYTYPLVRLFGHNSWAERFFGEGGTYVMWKLGGVMLIIGSLIAYRYLS